MKELRCPHCQRTFTVDESEYAELLSQVRNDSFQEELERRTAEINKTQEAEKKATLAELEATTKAEQTRLEAEIGKLRLQLEESQKSIEREKTLACTQKEQQLSQQFAQELQLKNDEIQRLKADATNADTRQQLAVTQAQQVLQEKLQEIKDRAIKALQDKDKRISELESQAQLEAQKVELRETHLREQHQNELKMKDEVIAQYKDFKARQSTKMIGESLEVFCNNQFETMVHPYLPSSQFGKDNDVVEGTKGDFVFRDYVDGIESVSIMFEMKNEAEETSMKHKNADFFDKLDKDRKKKNCEYAVLVTLLEIDNDLYNNGIYAVPNYNKMYVVRPQQFLTIISLLVQTGRNTVEVKRELAEARNKEIDVTHFEEKLEKMKNLFGGHVKDAATRYNKALIDIDKAIEQLTNMKEDLRLWVDHLYKADKNLDDLTIRSLTHNNPTMKAKFIEARETKDADVIE